MSVKWRRASVQDECICCGRTYARAPHRRTADYNVTRCQDCRMNCQSRGIGGRSCSVTGRGRVVDDVLGMEEEGLSPE